MNVNPAGQHIPAADKLAKPAGWVTLVPLNSIFLPKLQSLITLIAMLSMEVFIMASLTIRNLDESLKTKLRLQSAQHGCSMEAEVRNILRQVLLPSAAPPDFVSRINQRFAGIDTDALPIPERQTVRTPPDMDL